MDSELVIIYGLKLFSGGITFYYPEAYLANTKNEQPQYFKQAGSYEVIDSYKIDYKGTDHEALLKICNELSPTALENSFQKKSGKRQSLNQLFEVDLVKSTIRKKLDFSLQKFFTLIKENRFHLYFDVERKIHLDNSKVKFSPFPLHPLLKFEKTVTGTNYYFYLKLNDIVASPHTMNIKVLTYSPVMIFQDKTLFEVEQIDGNKLIPFISKEYIHIPARITHDYFTKFIKDIIAKVEVEVEGFEYEKINAIPKPIMKFSSGFTEDNFEVIPIFEYNDTRFVYGDRQKHKVNIDIGETNEIKVTQHNRNSEAEESLLKIFDDFDFEKTAAFRFKLKHEDPYQGIFTIIKNEKLFTKAGWSIVYPEINNNSINKNGFQITESVTNVNDWFDVNALIAVGDQQIPFTSLINHIKKENRIYKLKDGSVFIIPIEWMKKYERLAIFGEVKGDKIKISKSNYIIIDELDLGNNSGTKKVIVTEDDFDFQIPSLLKAELRPYQYDGAKWLVKHYINGLGACLADDMGLGKTLQTLALLCHVKEQLGSEVVTDAKGTMQLNLFDVYTTQRKALTTLIIVPSSLIFNWEREVKKFAPSLMLKIHTGPDRTKDYRALTNFDIILTSYPIAAKDEMLLEKINYEYIIIDEAHYIKNRDSKIFKALNRLQSKNKISLSGTPIENSLADLWSQMQFINPDILLTYPKFKKMYQDPIEKNKDENAATELKQLINPFILRRSKKEVLKDLPDMEELVYYCDMEDDQRELIESEKAKARNELLGANAENITKIHVFTALTRLRQLANHPMLIDEYSSISSCKYIEVTNTIDTLVKSENKLLIFSSYIGQLEIYKNYALENNINFAILTGDRSASDRKKAVDDFQNNTTCQLMFISIKAGNTGLNLTAANYVLILDPWWNPFIEEQAKARAHRIGQERNVTVIKFITKDTIEEKILHLQDRKLKLAGEFIDAQMMPDLDTETLDYLLSK